MKFGELIYETKPKYILIKRLCACLCLIPVITLVSSHSLTELAKDDWLGIMGYGVVFLACFLSSIPTKKNYRFFESGITQTEKGKQDVYYSYSEIAFIEYYRYTTKVDRRTYCYEGLVFWLSDTNYLELKLKNKPEKLYNIWKQLVIKNPKFPHQLTCCDIDGESQERYETFKTLRL